MNEDFVGYDLAVKLKEKGFNEPCYGYYHLNGGDDSFELCGNDSFDFLNSLNRFRIAAPFISQVLKWLREKHNILISPSVYGNEDGRIWSYSIINIETQYLQGEIPDNVESYEQSALKGIEYVLDNLI